MNVKAEQAARAYPEHNCFMWSVQRYYSNRLATYAKCGICGLITGFRWRSRWHRLRSLFTDAPLWSDHEI